MADLAGFWSYARADDEAEGGRIRRLAESIRTEYTMLTGNEVDVFVDRDDINWGDEWRRRIDEALVGTAFFIPVVTPRYFTRDECRRELLTFAGHAASLGVSELVLPLLYVSVPNLSPDSADEAVGLVARMQYEDWTHLRLEDESSADYRKAVHRLASRLADIAASVGDRLPALSSVGSDGESVTDEAPGFMDILAAAEEAMPRMQQTVEALPSVMQDISAVTQEAAQSIDASDKRGGGFVGRLRVAADYARALDDPASRFLNLATAYASDLVTVDAGMLTLIRMASEGLDAEDELRSACELFHSIREFAATSAENNAVMADFSHTVSETAKFSRELRPATNKLVTGLQRMMDGQAVIDEWVRQIDAAGVDCSGVLAHPIDDPT